MIVRPRRPSPRGFSLIEVLVVVTILGVLIAIPMPLFAKAVEQSKLDLAAANLRSIWAAQRLYFLQNGAFTDLNTLTGQGLLDPSIASGNTFYSYAITLTTAVTSNDSMTATASHPISQRCTGSISIDQDGNLQCSVTYCDGTAMTPSFEDRP